MKERSSLYDEGLRAAGRIATTTSAKLLALYSSSRIQPTLAPNLIVFEGALSETAALVIPF